MEVLEHPVTDNVAFLECLLEPPGVQRIGISNYVVLKVASSNETAFANFHCFEILEYQTYVSGVINGKVVMF